MPKTNDASGPSYYGYEGHVVDGHDRVWELDPSRNVDGSVKEGFESDEREIEERDPQGNVDTVSPLGESNGTYVKTSPQFGLPEGPTPVQDVRDADAARANRESVENADAGNKPTPGLASSERQMEQRETEKDADAGQGGEQSSDGTNSAPSAKPAPKSAGKKTSGR